MARTSKPQWQPDPLAIELFAHALVCASGKAPESLWEDFRQCAQRALARDEAAFDELMVEIAAMAENQHHQDVFDFLCDELELCAECAEVEKPNGRLEKSVLFCIPVCLSSLERVTTTLDARTLDAIHAILSEASVIGQGLRFELLPSLYPLETVAAWNPAQAWQLNTAAAARFLADLDEDSTMPELPRHQLETDGHLSGPLVVRTFCLLGVAVMPEHDLDALFPPILEEGNPEEGAAGYTSDHEPWAQALAAQLKASLGLMTPTCVIAAPEGFYTDVCVGLDMARNVSLAQQMEGILAEMGEACKPGAACIEPFGEYGLRAVAEVGDGREEEFYWPAFEGEDPQECAQAFVEALESSGFELMDAHLPSQPGQYLVH